LTQWVGAVRCVYNLCLEQRRDWYKPGRKFTYASQCKEITALRSEFEWIRDVPVHALQQAARDLEHAYKNWWNGHAKAPTPRKKGVNDSFRFPDPQTFDFRRISRNVGEVKLPKLGWVKHRWDKQLPGKVKSITVCCKNGVWFTASLCEIEIKDPEPSTLPPVGIDRGVAVFAALSNGSIIDSINYGKKAIKVLCRAQRKLSRKKKGSNNRKKQVRRVARIHLRISAARKDFCHKASATIAKNHGVVVLEKLEISNMTRSAKGTTEEPGKKVRQKSGLNRAILDQGWGMFRTMLSYKLAERGGRLVEVRAAYTSQTCAECGAVDAASRQTQSRFVCTTCGHSTNADTNAAINILRRWDTPLLPVEASGCRAIEAGNSQGSAS
jgi:putative transposase